MGTRALHENLSRCIGTHREGNDRGDSVLSIHFHEWRNSTQIP